MNPDNPQDQVSDPNLQKLEEDLQKLSHEAQTETPEVPTAPPAVPTIEEPAPIQTPPLMHEVPQKSSSLSRIATALIIIAVLALAAYFVGTRFLSPQSVVTSTSTPKSATAPTPSPDSTADWKTYSNTQYGFSFKYSDKLTSAQGVVAAPYTGTSKFLLSFSDPATIMEGTDAPFDGFSLYVVTNMKASSFEDYLQKEKEAMDSSPMAFMANAIRKDFPGGSSYISGNQGYYYLPSSDKKTVVVFAQIQKNETFRLTFDQTLSTFKFLSPTSLSSPLPPISY